MKGGWWASINENSPAEWRGWGGGVHPRFLSKSSGPANLQLAGYAAHCYASPKSASAELDMNQRGNNLNTLTAISIFAVAVRISSSEFFSPCNRS